MPVIATLLGSSGVVIRLWDHGAAARAASVVLLASASVWEVLLRRRGRRPVFIRWFAMACLVVLAAVATVPSVGRAPLLLLLASVAIADAALVPPPPTPHWPARSTRMAGLAVPLLVLAQVSWVRGGFLTVTLGLLAGASLVVAAYYLLPIKMERLDRVARRGVALLAGALGAVALLVVAVPLFYLPGAVGRLVGLGPFGRRRRRSTGSNWLPTTGDSRQAVDAAHLPFISPEPGSGRRRHLGSLATVVTVGVVVGGAIVFIRTDDAARGGSSDPTVSAAREADQLDLLEAVPYSDRPALDGVDYADALQADLAEAVLEPHPLAGYITADTATTHVNVEGGIRRTAQSSCIGCPQVDLWLVGASTVFGVGQRDDHTIGSVLVRLAAGQGIDLRVSNLSAPGWTLHQEANWLRQQLDSSPEQPDLVVFVDGFNDVTSAVARELAGRTTSTDPLVFNEGEMSDALAQEEDLGPDRTSVAVELAEASYRAEQAAISSELEAKGIPYRFFFQPDAFASQRQLDPVLETYTAAPRLIASGELGDVVARTVDRLSPWTESLRDVYGSVEEPLFIDVVHTNEEGARLVALAVFESLLPGLDRLAGEA